MVILGLVYTGCGLFHLVCCASAFVSGSSVDLRTLRLRRMIMFLDPWADQQGSGFQVVQSLIAIGSGSKRLDRARQTKMLFLPLPLDFIFAVIGESWDYWNIACC